MKVKLKDIGKIITGNTPSKQTTEYWDSDDICFVKPDTINENGISVISGSVEYLSEKARSKARIVGKDSILITCIGSIGKIGLVESGEYAFNQQINAIVPNDEMHPKYLAYALLYLKPQLASIANAPVVPIINKSQFGDFEIIITEDKYKQIEIAEALDGVADIIRKRNDQLNCLDDLIKARFVEMFDGKGFEQLDWSNVFITTTGKLDSNAMVPDGEFPFFTCAKEVFRIDNYAFNQEALLLAGNNAAGKYDVKYYKGKFNAYQRTYVLSLKEDWSYRLFKYQLEDKLEYLRTQSKGTNTKYLTLKILEELSFVVPPRSLQTEFESFVKQVDKSKVAIQKSLDETRLLFDSLMQEYFG